MDVVQLMLTYPIIVLQFNYKYYKGDVTMILSKNNFGTRIKQLRGELTMKEFGHISN